MVNDEVFDLLIVGGGPAGLTAAIYASRMEMRVLLLESTVPGGRAVEAPIVENFPGFPEGIRGIELVENMIKQAEKYGASIRYPEAVVDVNVQETIKTVNTQDNRYKALTILLATGTQRKKLLVPGETEFLGRGVSYCPLCDGPFFKGGVTAVIGSSDEALEDALRLSNLSKKVFVITEKTEFEADRKLIDNCVEKENIEILKATVKSITGDNEVESIIISDSHDDEKTKEVVVDGVFISLGRVPMTNLVKNAGITVDTNGCIEVDRKQTTNIQGVYAAGDCTCGGMQIVTAVGEGAMAAIQIYRYVKTAKLEPLSS